MHPLMHSYLHPADPGRVLAGLGLLVPLAHVPRDLSGLWKCNRMKYDI